MDRQVSPENLAHDRTAVERKSDRELVVTRTFDAPKHLLFKAWSQADLFRRWWVPRSADGISLTSCEMDVRTGGTYRLEFGMGAESMAFHGKYLEVVENEKIVWTNDEDPQGAISTVTFTEQGGKTLLTFHETYPTKEALDEAMIGSAAGLPEQLDQLDELLAEVAEEEA